MERKLLWWTLTCITFIPRNFASSDNSLFGISLDYDVPEKTEEDEIIPQNQEVRKVRVDWYVSAGNLEKEQTTGAIRQKSRDHKLSKFLNDITKLYDKRIRPNNYGSAVQTNVSMFVNSFYSIDELTMEYKINTFLRLRWKDPRLAHNFTSKPITLHPSILSEIWTPDAYFSNAKHAYFHMATESRDTTDAYRTGFELRINVEQVGTNEPVGYDLESLYFDWDERVTIKLPKSLQLPQFLIKGYKVMRCTKKYEAGSFTCLRAEFIFKRQMGYYVSQMYVPSCLIVALSWVGFWISIDAVPARTAVGITSVLTLITQNSGAKVSLPKVSYVKAIDIWFGACLLFVFAALLEFALVNFISRHPRKEFQPFHCFREAKALNHKRAKNIDRISRIVFPVAFIVFNLCYWATYLTDYNGLETAMIGATRYFH